MGFTPQAQPHAQSLFLFPVVFGINLIQFFDFFGENLKKNGAAGNSIVCFAASIPCQSRHLTVRRMRTVSKSATFLATESVNSAPFKGGETEVQIFWQGKTQNSSPILRCTFLARRSAKLIANFSSTMVTSLPSFSLSLSLSLSLCISLSHRMYLMHNIGSASALPITTESVNSAPFKGGENWGANFLARKSAKLVANTKVHIFGKEKCKTHRQF